VKIIKHTVIVAIIALLSRVIGFLREAIIANQLGVSGSADAVYLALTVPNIFQFVIGAAVANSIIPVLAKNKKTTANNKVFSNVIIFMTIFISILCGIILLFLDEFLLIIAPDLPVATRGFAKEIIIIVLPASVFIAISSVFRQILQMEEKVLMANIGQITMNAIVILIMIILAPTISGAYSLMYGMIIGSFITMFTQYIYLRKNEYRLVFNELSVMHTKEVFYNAGTVMIGLFLNQLYTITNRILASGLQEGSIAALSYSEKVIQLPLGVLAQSLGMVIYPILAKYASSGKNKELNKLLISSLKLVLLSSLPISILLIIYSDSIIIILFGRGAFDQNAIYMTSLALKMFSLMLVAQSLILIFTRFYYAIQKPKVPVYSIALTVIINIILSIYFKNIYSFSGIALANTISMLFNALYMLLIMKKYGISISYSSIIEGSKYFINLLVFLLYAIYIKRLIFIDVFYFDFIIKILFVICLYILSILFLERKVIKKYFNRKFNE